MIIHPLRGRQGRLPSLAGYVLGAGTRPDSPASADARPYTGYVHSGPFGYPASFPAPAGAVRRRPEAEAVLIGISVRLHLVFASGFLSVCEGKGLCVRRACQYVILRISSPPYAWPECSFYRRPICCLSAPYASHGVLEIHKLQTILHIAINTSEVWFFWEAGGKTKAGYTLRKSSTCTRLFAFRV